MFFKKTNLTASAVLLIGSIGLRVCVYFLLTPSEDLGKYSNSGELYFTAVTTHLKDYLSFTSNIPPGTFLIQASVLGLLGLKTAMQIRAFLILIGVFNISAVLLLFNGTKELGADEKISFWSLLLLSTAMIPVELWRDGMHYDHYTFFFTSFFAWSLVRCIKMKQNYSNSLWVALSGALLVLQSAANSAIVPVSVVCILSIVLISRKQYSKWLVNILISLSLPLLVIFWISCKNQNEAGESLTSNKAGPAMMMVVQRAYGYDALKVKELVIKSGAPDWYLWAYDHATSPIDPLTNKPAEGWINLSQAFGICFFPQSGKGKGPWEFEFDPLITYLKQNGPENLVPMVVADGEDAVDRPYRYAGFSPELSPRWIGIYGTVSKKIFFSALKIHTLGMTKAFIEQAGIFSIYGPLFPFNTIQHKKSILARSGLRTVQDNIPLYPLFIFATLILALAAFVTYIIMILNIPVVIWELLRRNQISRKTILNNPFLLLSIPAVGITLIFSCLVGGENDRYFIQMLPYLILLTILAITRMSRK